VITTLDLTGLPSEDPPPAVVSIGVFDGVHLGHQAILAANVARARQLGARPTVVTFRHHPKELLLGRAPRTLTTLEHRLELFQRAGIEHCVALTFDEKLRSMPAEAFAEELLVHKLGARSFVLGFDSKFGAGRTGGPDLLRAMGYEVEVVEKVILSQRAVSSTAIREAVELGDLTGAERMLGRPVSVFGEVVRGAQLGRKLGFPTANLDLHHELHPPVGVYACRAHRVLQQRAEVATTYPAVANIGFRPTLDGARPERPLVEVHLLDFDGELYGEHLELEFVCQLREERRFADLDALKAQIAVDVAAGRERLSDSGPSL